MHLEKLVKNATLIYIYIYMWLIKGITCLQFHCWRTVLIQGMCWEKLERRPDPFLEESKVRSPLRASHNPILAGFLYIYIHISIYALYLCIIYIYMYVCISIQAPLATFWKLFVGGRAA